MKKGLLVTILLALLVVLQGCYLEPISNYEYYTEREEEELRIDIYEQYYDINQVFFDTAIHDEDDMDWIEFLKQDSSFKRFTEEFSEYMFLIEIDADGFHCNNETSSINLIYNDISHGYHDSIHVECINIPSMYDNIYEREASITVNDTTYWIMTRQNNQVEITNGITIQAQEISTLSTFVFDDQVIAVQKVPLGYRVSLDDQTLYIYDYSVID